jgi:hypothetical protein
MDGRKAHFVCVATTGDVNEARVLAARLEAEGIEARVHSEALGPYPVTVGQMAVAELWVMEDRLEDAKAVLLDAELSDILEGAGDDTRRVPTNRELQLLAIVVIAAFLLAVVLRLMRVF